MVGICGKIAAGLLFLASLSQYDSAGKEPAQGFWLEDFQLAKTQAIAEEKALLLVFTGSDWCVWCQKMENEVFERDAFESHASSTTISVRVDFPQRRKLPPRQQRKNDLLKAAWKVEALPTVILYDPIANKEIWRHSYLQSSPQAYAEGIKKALDHTRNKQDEQR